MDEIILNGICTEKGIAYQNRQTELIFCEGNIGKRVVAKVNLEERYTDKERMYAYYFGPLLSIAVTGYTDAGYEGVDKVSADYMLAAQFLKGFVTRPDGEKEATVLSKSKISKERMLKFITDCIFFLETELNMEVPDSTEWKAYKVTGRKLINPSAKKG